jgi:hypothetical protein
MGKKKKGDWLKKAGKHWAKAGTWIGNNINPSVLNGTYGDSQMGGFDRPPRRAVSHRRTHKSKKSSSGGKTITIRIE